MSLDDMVATGTATGSQARALRQAVTGRRTLLISGATGTGKTTLANALLTLVPASERIVSVEETQELRPRHPHHVALLTRAPSAMGSGGVDPSELLRASLRMRPDRIVVGEARGAEALVAVRALATGHKGSVLTLHARDARHALTRLCHLAMSSPGAPSHEALRADIDDAIDVVIHLERTSQGRRIVELLDRR